MITHSQPSFETKEIEEEVESKPQKTTGSGILSFLPAPKRSAETKTIEQAPIQKKLNSRKPIFQLLIKFVSNVIAQSLSFWRSDTINADRMRSVILLSHFQDRFFVLVNDQKLYFWGKYEDRTYKLRPTLVPIPSSFLNLVCGSDFAIGITISDQTLVWGGNYFGQLGLGHNQFVPSPTELKSPGQKWKKFRCGQSHAFGCTYDNKFFSWGWNSAGQLGIGTESNFETTPIPLNHQFMDIICGFEHSFGITPNHHVLTWGGNNWCQLGLEPYEDQISPTPFQLPLPSPVTYQIYCGAWSSYALLDSGQIYSWGYNINGELGVGGNTNRAYPTQINLPNGAKCMQFFCGISHCFLKTNKNEIYAWGRNTYGELGLGHDTAVWSPVLIPNFTPHTIICCQYTSFGVDQDGTVYAWGSNFEGQYGNGTTESQFCRTQWKMTPPQWNQTTHHTFGRNTKQAIKTIMTMSLWNRNTGAPIYPKSLFHVVPKDILFIICGYVANLPEMASTRRGCPIDRRCEEIRNGLKIFLKSVIGDTITSTTLEQKDTVTATDIVNTLKKRRLN